MGNTKGKIFIMAETYKWLNWDFEAFKIDAKWAQFAGVYIFARVNQLTGKWEPLYVGETTNFVTRPVGYGHEKWQEALELQITHIHAIEVSGELTRHLIERRLIEHFNPPLNRQ